MHGQEPGEGDVATDVRRADQITLYEASLLLGVSGTTVRNLIKAGHLSEVGRLEGPRGRASIVVRRMDVERLAMDGWPGRQQGAATRAMP